VFHGRTLPARYGDGTFAPSEKVPSWHSSRQVASQPGVQSILGNGFAAFPERSDERYAFASWRRAGIIVAGSSDAPVITTSPLVRIRDAVLRRTRSGRMLGPG
jgi:hypothetical protein